MLNVTADFRITSDILPHTGLTIQYIPVSTSFLPSGISTIKQSTNPPLTFIEPTNGDPINTTLRVPLHNDDLAEANGTVQVTLQSETPTNTTYKLAATNTQATVHVEDDDSKVPVLFIAGPANGTAESVGSVEFTVTAYDVQAKTNSINPERTITIQYTPAEVDSGDFFTDEDTARTADLTFTQNNGIWSDTFSVAIDNDTNADPTGKIKITLDNDPATIDTYTVATGDDASAEATIWDDDAPELTILAGNAVTEGTDANASFRVIANVLPSSPLSIQYTPEGANYIAGSGTKLLQILQSDLLPIH